MSRAKRTFVSVTSETYAKLQAYCELYGIPVAALVERQVNEYLDKQPENLLGDGRPVDGGDHVR